MADLEPEIVGFSPAGIDRAVGELAAGRCVVCPTETVYGLAGDAVRDDAVAAIYRIKGRASNNPLIVHVPDLAAALPFGIFDTRAIALAEAHWPGPLTLVVPRHLDAQVSGLVGRDLPTIALRVPAHRAMRALLSASGMALAAPSANRSNGVSPTKAAHVVRSLGARAPLIIDDGDSPGGLESTVIACVDDTLQLLRPGAILVPEALTRPVAQVISPGLAPIHYAPDKPLRLDATVPNADEFMIGLGPVTGEINLSRTGDLEEAAARLFDALFIADAAPPARIAIASIPATGIGIAINDRLRRAAGFHRSM